MSNVVDKIFVCTNSSTLYTAQCTLSFPCTFAFFPQNMMQDYDTNKRIGNSFHDCYASSLPY